MNDLTQSRPPKTATVQTDTFLNPAEMQDLTGYKAASKQCQQLRSQGIPFFVNARGHPRVARETISGGTKKATPKPKPKWEPNI